MRMTVPQEVLRRLRNEVPIADVIDRLRVPTARRGSRRLFRCPHCERFRTGVNRISNLARCFRCERNFNPIDLVMAVSGATVLDAVRYLGDFVAGGTAADRADSRDFRIE